MKEPIGYYPIDKDGEPVAVVHIYPGREYECHQRALYLAQALAKYEQKECTDQTGGPLEYYGPPSTSSAPRSDKQLFNPSNLSWGGTIDGTGQLLGE